MSEILFEKTDWGYDAETYPNAFTLTFVNAYNDKIIRQYEISDRVNDLDRLMEFFRYLVKNKCSLIGFNNVGFDYNLVHYILEKAIQAKTSGKELKINSMEMYAEAQSIIEKMKGTGFGKTVAEPLIRQVDLYKIHHFDNKARATSLKMLEFNMHSQNIEDLPFPVGKTLTSAEIDVLLKYNLHDVMETLAFARRSITAINFRKELTEKFGFDCTNLNDTKIGKEYFINLLEKENPGCCYGYDEETGRRFIKQTKRNVICIKDALFDYLHYDRPEFKALHQWFKEKTITETKGVMSDLLEHELGDLAQYADMDTKSKLFKKELPDLVLNKKGVYVKEFKMKPDIEDYNEILDMYPKAWFEEKKLKSKKEPNYYYNWRVASTLNVKIDGNVYYFGTGGIHMSIPQSAVYSDEEWMIIDCDVASMYPNIAISNRVYPLHLGEKFCDIYEQVYNQRKSYPKGSPENAVMKLALNGVYGDSNNQFSPFYDPMYTMKITINGQLSLLMLVEKFLELGCEIIQCNTDGITVRVRRKDEARYYEICKWWENVVGLQLEYAEYEKMFIRDVNNYIAIFTNGKVKRKGAYEYDGLGWHQNHSSLVIQKAVEHELLGKGTVEEFIMNHRNMDDFMLRTKVDRSSSLVITYDDGIDRPLQNICRFYPSKDGGYLTKIMPPLKGKEEYRRLSILRGQRVTPCNNKDHFDWNVDYDYYINEAKKLTGAIISDTLEDEFDDN